MITKTSASCNTVSEKLSNSFRTSAGANYYSPLYLLTILPSFDVPYRKIEPIENISADLSISKAEVKKFSITSVCIKFRVSVWRECL